MVKFQSCSWLIFRCSLIRVIIFLRKHQNILLLLFKQLCFWHLKFPWTLHMPQQITVGLRITTDLYYFYFEIIFNISKSQSSAKEQELFYWNLRSRLFYCLHLFFFFADFLFQHLVYYATVGKATVWINTTEKNSTIIVPDYCWYIG